jgi:AcrR family transcriptional regulator
MDPEARKELILETAARLVMKHGITNTSLEMVASCAGISKALVYKYFPNRDALLGALLKHEFEVMRRLDNTTHGRAKLPTLEDKLSIDEVLSIEVHSYLSYLVERGGLFRMLVSDAGLAEQIQSELRSGRDFSMRFWIGHLTAHYDLPLDLIRVGVIMTSYGLEGAQGSVKSGKIEADRLADFWTTFVSAGWKAAAKKYGRAVTKASR